MCRRRFSAIEILTAATIFVTDNESANGLGIGPGGTLDLVSGSSLTLANSVAGLGTVELDGTGGDPMLALSGTVFLLGPDPTVAAGGEILLNGPTANNLIIGVAGTDAKLINVQDTIIGSGTIGQGDGNLTLVNGVEGTINATGLLVIDTGNQVVNSGLMEATAGGTLQIDDNVGNAGVIEALGADARVLLSNSIIHGGTLTTGSASSNADGIFEIASASGANLSEFDGSSNGAMTVGAYVQVDGAAVLELAGTINLTGTIAVASGGALTLADANVVGGAINLAAATGTPSITEISLPGISSVAPVISASGDYTAFISASALPPGHDTGLVNPAVELYDGATNQLTNISALVPSGDLHSGEQFGNLSAISANGQYVEFEGQYQVFNSVSNFNQPDTGPNTNTQSDLFLYNTGSGAVTYVTSLVGGNGNAALNGNGQLIAAETTIFGNTNNGYQSFDEALVLNTGGTPVDTITGDPNFIFSGGNTTGDPGSVENPTISANGEFVTFWSTASVIAVTNANGVTTDFSTGNAAETVAQVYVYDRETNSLQMVSVNNQGEKGNAESGSLSLGNNNNSWASGVSGNGTYVVFQSAATNLVPGPVPVQTTACPALRSTAARPTFTFTTRRRTRSCLCPPG